MFFLIFCLCLDKAKLLTLSGMLWIFFWQLLHYVPLPSNLVEIRSWRKKIDDIVHFGQKNTNVTLRAPNVENFAQRLGTNVLVLALVFMYPCDHWSVCLWLYMLMLILICHMILDVLIPLMYVYLYVMKYTHDLKI